MRLRIRRRARRDATTFCDSCGQVCDPASGAAARLDEARTRALAMSIPR